MTKKNDGPRDDAELVQFKLRIREGLRSQIDKASSASGRSMNAEIAARLQESFDFDGLFTAGLKPALGAVAFDAWRVQNHTGKAWDQDRASALAIAEMAGDAFRYGTPMVNSEKLTEAMKSLKSVTQSIERKTGYLEDIGAIEKIAPKRRTTGLWASIPNALQPSAAHSAANGLLEPYIQPQVSPTDEWQDTATLLRKFGFQPTVNLDAPPAEWDLSRDSERISQEELVGVRAVFESLGRLNDEYEKRFADFDKADEPEKAAEAEAKRIVQSLRGSSNAS